MNASQSKDSVLALLFVCTILGTDNGECRGFPFHPLVSKDTLD